MDDLMFTADSIFLVISSNKGYQAVLHEDISGLVIERVTMPYC
jgi:hypothetical protein